MATSDQKHEEHPPIAGPRRNVLSVMSLGMLGLFTLVIIVLLVSDVMYLVDRKLTFAELRGILQSDEVVSAIRLSMMTSLVSLVLVILVAVPTGYALSRYRFPGRALLDTIVDIPILLPPVVIGISLLAFFRTPVGGLIKQGLATGNWSLVSAIGIVLCQFLVSVSFAIRAVKASFDQVDVRLEHVALSLGCSRFRAFRKVTLPLARSGLIAGSVVAWARALGVFGALMVFVGTGPRVQVMPTAIYLELNWGNVEAALAIALISVVMVGAALVVVHWLLPGRKWT